MTNKHNLVDLTMHSNALPHQRYLCYPSSSKMSLSVAAEGGGERG